MQRVMQVLAVMLLAGAQFACANNTLNPSFGQRYNNLFIAQASERAAQAPQAMRGEEERRVIGAYYDRLAPDPSQGGGGGSSSMSSMTGTSLNLSPASSSSPFSSSGGGGMDMRAR